MEDVSEDDEESLISIDEDDKPQSRRRKCTNHSVGEKLGSTQRNSLKPARSMKKKKKKKKTTVLRSVPASYVKIPVPVPSTLVLPEINAVKTRALTPITPTTPRNKITVKSQKVPATGTLPPTPQSGPSLLDIVGAGIATANYNFGTVPSPISRQPLSPSIRTH